MQSAERKVALQFKSSKPTKREKKMVDSNTTFISYFLREVWSKNTKTWNAFLWYTNLKKKEKGRKQTQKHPSILIHWVA